MLFDISGAWLYVYTWQNSTEVSAAESYRQDYRVKKAIAIHSIVSLEVSESSGQIRIQVQGIPHELSFCTNDTALFQRNLNILRRVFELVGIDHRYLLDEAAS
jgi:hypothetical protein